MNLVLLEPTWEKHIHLPNNLGWLKIARQAFPEAELSFIGETEQQHLMQAEGDITRLQYLSWPVGEDTYRPFRDLIWRHKTLKGPVLDRLKKADAILMLSCTPSTLNHLTWRGLARKTWAFLHGNANDLMGWRSRNPLLRPFDFTTSLQRFCQHGGTVVVLETRIVTNLIARFPWLKGHLIALPHPILENEGSAPRPSFALPLHIGFVGNASQAKGFQAFCELAHRLKKARPEAFRFHVIGKLAEDAKHLDQSALDTPAASNPLPRDTFNQLLQQQHFMFQWHSNDYYDLAASGVIYDAINQGIPLIARLHGELAYWAEQQRPLGLCEVTLKDLETALLTSIDDQTLEKGYGCWQENLALRKQELATGQLALALSKALEQ